MTEAPPPVDLKAALPSRLRRLASRLLKQPILFVAMLASVLSIVFWGFVASDRYVSEARIIIQRTDLTTGSALDFGSILTGNNGSRADQMLLRDHLLSIDMLRKLDAKLDLRSHYSDSGKDPLLRMWDKDTPLELFHEHYLSRVSVELDDYAGVLVVKAQAYDPKTAHAITSMLVEEGERTMNEMAHRLAREQVSFIEKQVAELAGQFRQARTELVAYQNKKGLVSPQHSLENLAGVVNRLEAERSELQARRGAMLGYLSPTAPGIVELDLQIKAAEKQIVKEQERLAGPTGKALNSTVEEFQRLQLAAEFAQDVYKTALVALEKGRVEATRTLKKVTVVQSPTLPEYAAKPSRMYRIAVYILVTLLLAGIVQLLSAIIRDHRD